MTPRRPEFVDTVLAIRVRSKQGCASSGRRQVSVFGVLKSS